MYTPQENWTKEEEKESLSLEVHKNNNIAGRFLVFVFVAPQLITIGTIISISYSENKKSSWRVV